jgi:hypothetical protein
LSDIDVCNAWGVLPSQFGICTPAQDFAYMSAYVRAKRLMDSYDDYLQAEEIKRKAGRGKS